MEYPTYRGRKVKTATVLIRHDKHGMAHAKYGDQTFTVEWERPLADWDNDLGAALGLSADTANSVAHEILGLAQGESRAAEVVICNTYGEPLTID